jgi:hypothetical protein
VAVLLQLDLDVLAPNLRMMPLGGDAVPMLGGRTCCWPTSCSTHRSPSGCCSARRDRTVARLAAEVPELFLADAVVGDETGNLAADLSRLQLRDRLRFVWYRLTSPSQPERWSAVPVGGHWLPLHGFLRPSRGAVQAGARAAAVQYLAAGKRNP